MWIFTTRGFVSVVAHRAHPGLVVVRARSRAHLVSVLKAAFGNNEGGSYAPERDDTADYRWRVELMREEWAALALKLVGEINYPNFKNAAAKGELKKQKGIAYSSALHEVWHAMHAFQTTNPEEGSK